MHLTKNALALASGLLAATCVAAEPAQNLLPRATSDSSACASSYNNVFSSSQPTATDKALSSWLSAHASTTADVPQSLTSEYCTYDKSRASWVKSSLSPFVSECSSYLDSSVASSLSEVVDEYSTTTSWCSSIAGNAAPARETGYLKPGIMAAAGLVAAVL